MATAKLDIFNWALSIAGAKQSISGTTNDGRELEVCELWYPIVRDKVLRAAPWPSTRMVSRLALSKEFTGDISEWQNGDVDPGYRYAYTYPTKMLRPRFLWNYGTFITGMLTPTTPVIMTNECDAILVYTYQQDGVGAWDSDLQLAIAHGLAAYICIPLNGKTERINYALQTANNALIDARVSQSNQDMMKVDTTPEWFTARGYGQNAQLTRFIYPHGELLAPPSGWQASAVK